MNSNTLEKWQAKQIAKSLFPGTNYLVRLRRRMEKVGFPQDDDFYKHVCAAYEAVNRLYLKAHHLSSSGVGGPSTFGHDQISCGEDDMCGRFVRARASEAYGDFFGVPDVPKLFASFNVAPTQQILALRVQGDAKAFASMRWGLIPSWAKDKKTPFINARGETVAEKPAFRSAFKKRRCLIVADGYYEWKALEAKRKQPYYFRLKSDEPIGFAGLWETWSGEGEPIESCAIITTEANELSRAVHDRMPVILRRSDADAWLDPDVEDVKALVPLLRPFPAEEMMAVPVSSRVNKVSENDAELIKPEMAS